MQNFDQLTEDYSRHRVPDSITVNGLKITVVLVGAIITLPVFLVGAQLANALGLKQAIVAFFVAGIALSVIAGATDEANFFKVTLIIGLGVPGLTLLLLVTQTALY